MYFNFFEFGFKFGDCVVFCRNKEKIERNIRRSSTIKFTKEPRLSLNFDNYYVYDCSWLIYMMYTDSETTRSLKGPEGEQVEGGNFSSLPIQTPNFSWAEPNTLN